MNLSFEKPLFQGHHLCPKWSKYDSKPLHVLPRVVFIRGTLFTALMVFIAKRFYYFLDQINKVYKQLRSANLKK